MSSTLQRGASRKPGTDTVLIQRVPAKTLEDELTKLIERLVPKSRGVALALPRRIEVHREAVHLTLRREDAAGIQGRLTEQELLIDDADDAGHLRIIAEIRIRNRRGKTEIVAGTAPKVRRDPILIKALRRAHDMLEFDTKSLPVCQTAPGTQYARRLLQLAFLAPDLQKAIIAGRQPAGLNLDQLMSDPLPFDWDEQRKLFA